MALVSGIISMMPHAVLKQLNLRYMSKLCMGREGSAISAGQYRGTFLFSASLRYVLALKP